MMSLFMMECKKTARGVLYWLYILALFFVCIRQFDAAVEDELRGKVAVVLGTLFPHARDERRAIHIAARP